MIRILIPLTKTQKSLINQGFPIKNKHRFYDTVSYHNYGAFLGKDGDFDRIVSTSVKRTQRRFGKSKSSHVWVLPYLTSDLKANEKFYSDYYDEIELATDVTGIYLYKSAFWRRNRMMVDRADLVVVYVDHKSNGAYKAYEYALKIGKNTVNLSHCPQKFREN